MHVTQEEKTLSRKKNPLSLKFIAADCTHVGNNAEKTQQSVGGVQSLLRVAAVHDEEEAFGELRADPPSRGRDAFPSADQEVREQGGLLAAAPARFIGLLKDACNSKDGKLFCWQIRFSHNRTQRVLMWLCCADIYVCVLFLRCIYTEGTCREASLFN